MGKSKKKSITHLIFVKAEFHDLVIYLFKVLLFEMQTYKNP